jgi:hypothetical protein
MAVSATGPIVTLTSTSDGSWGTYFSALGLIICVDARLRLPAPAHSLRGATRGLRVLSWEWDSSRSGRAQILRWRLYTGRVISLETHSRARSVSESRIERSLTHSVSRASPSVLQKTATALKNFAAKISAGGARVGPAGLRLGRVAEFKMRILLRVATMVLDFPWRTGLGNCTTVVAPTE